VTARAPSDAFRRSRALLDDPVMTPTFLYDPRRSRTLLNPPGKLQALAGVPMKTRAPVADQGMILALANDPGRSLSLPADPSRRKFYVRSSARGCAVQFLLSLAREWLRLSGSFGPRL